ncbi:BRCA1 BRCA2-containing complex, subunit 3 [Dissophora ornata]|nr:BRCA1 BRCA2-containing complex, subunit 3 [Dissophora ornata]
MSRSSSLSRVLVQSNVLHILLAHALSTEKKEGAMEIARVDGVSLLTRSEKRKDRVEIGPEQLTMAAIEAEEITQATGKTTRVIGWSNKIQVTCFQSRPSDGASCQHIKLPFSVLNENPLESLTLPKLLEIPERIFDEQRQSFYKSIPMSATSTTPSPLAPQRSNSNTSTGGRSSFFSLSPTRAFSFSSSTSSQQDREGDTIMSPTPDVEAEEQSRRRSKNDRGSMDDIPAEQLSTKYINQRAMSLPDRMTLIRNSGVYVQSLSSLVDNLVGPTLQMLVDREQYNQSLLESLKVQKQALLHQLKTGKTFSGGKDLVDLSDP